jgi:hypothetical protein
MPIIAKARQYHATCVLIANLGALIPKRWRRRRSFTEAEEVAIDLTMSFRKTECSTRFQHYLPSPFART